MHQLYEYVCDELKELENKAAKGLTRADVEYADKLAHLKKNLMKADEMMRGENGEYSMAYYPMTSYAEEGGNGYMMNGRSFARRRDSMGRYSSRGYSMADDGFRKELESLIDSAPNEKVRQKLSDLMREI